MTTFQILLIAALGALLVVTVVGLIRGWASRRIMAAWTALWIVGLLAAIWPDTTTRVANALGIERGKDLLLYCTALIMPIGFFMLYVRLRRVRRDLTVVVRHIAHLDAHERIPTDDEGA